MLFVIVISLEFYSLCRLKGTLGAFNIYLLLFVWVCGIRTAGELLFFQ